MPNVDLNTIDPNKDFIYMLSDNLTYCVISKEDQDKVESFRESYGSFEKTDEILTVQGRILQHNIQQNLLILNNVLPQNIKMNTLRGFSYIMNKRN